MKVLSSFFRTKKMLAIATLALFALGAKAQSSQASKTKIRVVTIENGQKQTKEIIIDGEADPAAIQKALKDNGINDVELPPLPPPPPPQGAEGQEVPPPPHHFKKIIVTKTADGDSTVKVEEGFWPEHHGGKRGHHPHDGDSTRQHGRHHHHPADSAHHGKHGHHHHRHHHHGDSTVNKKRVVIVQQTTTTGISAARKAAKNKEIALFPNPSNGVFTVSYNNTKATADLTMTITNSKGQQIRTEKLKGNSGYYEANVDLTDQPKGTYIVVLTGDGSKKTKKVVVE